VTVREPAARRRRPYPYDLHMHSDLSDGALPWPDLLELCAEVGLQGLAITEHNLVGPVEDIAAAADDLGLGYIPAVEIKTTCAAQIEAYGRLGHDIHHLFPVQELLIYGVDPLNEDLARRSRTHLQGKRQYVRELCRLLARRSTAELPGVKTHAPLELDPEAIISAAGAYVGSTHVLQALLERYGHLAPGLTKAEVKPLVLSQQPAAAAALEGDPFFGLDLLDAVPLARRWGAVVVLAHPFAASRHGMEAFYRDHLLPALVDRGLDGIEHAYPEHTPAELTFLDEMSRRFGLLRTGGSDFHRKGDSHFAPGRGGVFREGWRQLRRLVQRRG